MKELHKLIKELDSLPNNSTRKEYLNKLLEDTTIPKDHLRRLSAETLKEDNFIDKIYKQSFLQFIRMYLNKFYKSLKAF